MFIFNWLREFVANLGLWKKRGKVLFLGLDDAGKTCLLHVLRDDRMSQHVPTLHPTSEELTVGNMTLTAFDLGGHKQARRVWREYFPAVDAVVFLIDASSRDRFDESRREFESLMNDEAISHCPILVLGNKIDKHYAASEDEIRYYFQLPTTGKGKVPRDELEHRRPLEIFMCSVLRRQGYGEGLEWLSQYIE